MWVVKANDNTFINVGIVASEATAEQVQCVATLDLYSRSIVYASHLITQTMKQNQSYDKPRVISIWIIKNAITHGNIKNRIAPIEDAILCLQPTVWGDNCAPFVDQLRIIWVQLAKFKNKDLMKNISELLQNWIKFFDKPEEIKSEDSGIKRAQSEWAKITSDEQMKALPWNMAW